MKRTISILLSLYFLFSGFAAAAINSPLPSASLATVSVQQAAQTLYDLGLFGGTGVDSNGNPIFELERTPTRQEAITMLVRLLGKETDAKARAWNTPFSDVEAWAAPYVGYAYANKISSGISPALYGGKQPVTASQYLAFVLQALGYTSGTDFQWDKAWVLSDKIGLTNGEYNAYTNHFTRGDVAVISYRALDCNLKDKSLTLRNSFTNPSQQVEDQTTEHIAPLPVKKEILKNTYESYQSAIKAFTACANGLLLLEQQTDSPELIVSSAKQCQQELSKTVKLISTTIALCSDYEDAQRIKNGFVKIQNDFLALTSYALSDTPKNVIDYLLMVSKSTVTSNLSEIQAEVNQWTNDN